MVETAEAVAAENGIERAQLDEVTAHRYEQYGEALADDRAFQADWMVPVTIPRGRKEPLVVDREGSTTPLAPNICFALISSHGTIDSMYDV